MYVSFKVWFDTCNKILLSVKWYRCLDLAIYADLFTLNYEFYLFKENYKNIYDGLITNGASVLITKFEIFAKMTLSKTLF